MAARPMFALCLQSLCRHLKWWLQAISPSSRRIAPLTLRRLIFLLILFPLFCGLQVIHWLGFLIDEICFRDYRKVEVKAPVFISGIPRSGTTFVHRTLAEDSWQFTSMTTWEAVLAPSIFERKCVHVLAWINRKCGGAFSAMLSSTLRYFSGDMDDIHEIDLSAPEEDYLTLLPAASCFILLLAFPQSTWLSHVGTLQQIPHRERRKLVEFYKRCLQKHLYLQPTHKRLLSKNAAFASWTPELIKAFPDAEIILCIREPESGLSSQLSSLAPARKLFGTDPSGQWTRETFTKVFTQNYQLLADETNQPDANYTIIDQGDLRANPADIFNQLVNRLKLETSDRLTTALSKLKPSVVSTHQHSAESEGLDPEQIKICLRPPYEAMLKSNQRISLTDLK